MPDTEDRTGESGKVNSLAQIGPSRRIAIITENLGPPQSVSGMCSCGRSPNRSIVISITSQSVSVRVFPVSIAATNPTAIIGFKIEEEVVGFSGRFPEQARVVALWG